MHGRAAALDEAVAVAASLLGRSRRAAIAGLDADIAAIEAAIKLARRLDGIVDHRASRATLRDLDVMRTVGWITTTPLQARARADLVVLVGDGLEQDWPGLEERLALAGPPPLPLSRILRTLGRTQMPLPHFLLEKAIDQMFKMHLTSFPAPELDHIRYVCMVDDRRARDELGYAPAFGPEETIRAVDEERWP